MINQKIEHFAFWTPVKFTESTNLGNSQDFSLTNLFWQLGSWADQYASLSQKSLLIHAERLNARKIYCELSDVQKPSMWITALKASSYVLSLFILPQITLTLTAIVLTAKVIFKLYLNSCMTSTKKSPNIVIAEKQIGKTKVVLLTGSLTDETTDAIVNAANARLITGRGVCGAIEDEAGGGVFNECKEILNRQKQKSIMEGEAVLTSAGNLAPRIKVIAHAVGPIYDKKAQDNADLLAQAYKSSLQLVSDPKAHPEWISSKVKPDSMRSIAFPSISTGIFGYPLDEAPEVAFKAVKDFIEANPNAFDEVRFVFLPLDRDLKQQTLKHYQDAFEKLDVN